METSQTDDVAKKLGNAIGLIIAVAIILGIVIITLKATLHF